MVGAPRANPLYVKIITALDHQRTVAQIDVVSSTLLVYDVMTNLPVEIEYVWTRKWTFVTVLYLLQRYLPFFDSAGMALHNHFGADMNIRTCTVDHNIAAWSFLVGIGLSELLLTLRVWAVWKRSIPVGIGLLVFGIACFVPCFIFLARFLRAIQFVILPISNFRGCFIAGGNNILYVCWVFMMVYDTGTLVMMLIPGVTAYRRGGRSGLVTTIYEDGVIYYVLVFLCSMVNLVVILTLPPDFVQLLTVFERVLHSLLTSRALLHIRQVFDLQQSSTQIQTVSQMRFQTVADHSSTFRTEPSENTFEMSTVDGVGESV